MIKRGLPIFIAIAFGVLTLVSILLSFADLGSLIINWVTLLAAFALLLGILNLAMVHLRRLFVQRNLYSGILVLSLISVLVLAVTDGMGITTAAVDFVFNQIQVPLEAALTALLAFFLLFAGFRLLRRQHNWGAVLFVLSAVIILVNNALSNSTLLPDSMMNSLQIVYDAINNVFVIAGMRGILIGVALGTITLSVRILIGMSQPYNK